MSDPIARLDALLVDDPFHEQFAETLVVAGDLLQSRGQLRGEQIAHEIALARAGDGSDSAEARAYAEWLGAHEARIFGKLAPLRHRAGAMRCRFRGGRLVGLSLDLRRVNVPHSELHEIVSLHVSAPTVRHVRELRVRVRSESEIPKVQRAVVENGRKMPLEILMISPTTRPLGHHVRGHAAELRDVFPRLWFVTHQAQIASVYDPGLVDETTAHEIEGFEGAGMDQALRVCVGRGLASGRVRTTQAACEVIAGLGASGRVFAPVLDLLLRRRVSHAAAWLLPALPRFGAWARQLIPRVRSITGDVGCYPDSIRVAAGHCLAKFAAGEIPER